MRKRSMRSKEACGFRKESCSSLSTKTMTTGGPPLREARERKIDEEIDRRQLERESECI